MKTSFQAPTKGPLITVSFDDNVASVTQAFSLVGRVVLPPPQLKV